MARAPRPIRTRRASSSIVFSPAREGTKPRACRCFTKSHTMDPKTVVRVAVVVCLAGTVLACAIDVARFHRTSEHAAELKQDTDDPLPAELARCKVLKADTANDSGCKAAWATSRE